MFRATIGRVRPTPVLAALTLTLLAGTAAPAAAHATARVRVAAPAEGAQVTGGTVRVVLVGEGGDSPASFRLDLDGKPVDARGEVGGLFTSLNVGPGAQLVLDVPVALGEHQLTMTPVYDPDSPQEPVVRRFSVVEKSGPGMTIALAGLAVAGAVGAAVAVRRKAATAGPADTTDA